MHNIAITLSKMGYEVTGSDDELQEPSRSRLKAHHLLPEENGWFPEKITLELEAVIIGMHAKADNPELVRAKDLGIKTYSYSEFIYEISRKKTRVVVAGSYGKTTIASMIMHVLSYYGIKHDFIVGTQLEGYSSRVKLTKTARIMIIDGNEKPSSNLDPRPKFLHYYPNIAIITGIAWEQVDLFPEKKQYTEQFTNFIDSIQKDGTLIYCKSDIKLNERVSETPKKIELIGYEEHKYEVFENKNFLIVPSGRIPFHLFGDHNMQNISGAKSACLKLGISEEMFYTAVMTYKGTTKHLQMLAKNESSNVYLDMAHSPAKLNASVSAVKKQFPGRKLVVCLELPSSENLNSTFLAQYAGSLRNADIPFVYYNSEHLSDSNFPLVSQETIKNEFRNTNVKMFENATGVLRELSSIQWKDTNLLFVSAGNFSAVDFSDIAEKLIAMKSSQKL